MDIRRQGGRRAKRLTSLLTAAALALGLCAPMTLIDTTGSAAQAAETGTFAFPDRSWRNTDAATTPEGASRKPVLYNLLGQNNKVETGNDELRMDFVLRVAHGEVDPTVATGANPGMRIIYDYGDGYASDGNGGYTSVPDYTHTVTYLNTDSADGSVAWANNQDERFTILKTIESGPYDYLTVSVEGDLNYPDNDSDDPNSKDYRWWAKSTPEGLTLQQHIYVSVGPASVNGGDYALGNATTDNLDNVWPLTARITSENDKATVYPNYCGALNYTDHVGQFDRGCQNPASFVGWDANPKLWSAHQSNWGLDTDNGFKDSDRYYKNGTDYPEGTAPPNSFFVNWFDIAAKDHETNPCFRHTDFKFQWFGLKDGDKWEPVTDLTPQAEEVDGQPAMRWTEPPLPTDGGGWYTNYSSSYNSVTNIDNQTNPYNLMAKDASGNLMPAQNADGSIDFKKAKDDQGLDGYFKLVTWPVMPSDCNVDDAQYEGALEPSDTNAANPTDVSSTADADTDTPAQVEANQSNIQRRINTGWTIDTAYYKFDVNRPDAPTIDSVSNGIDASATETAPKALKTIAEDDSTNYALGDTKVTIKVQDGNAIDSAPEIHGTGTAGDVVSLYDDEPSAAGGKAIKKSDPQETDTQGTLVGKATVGVDGTWKITDSKALSGLPVTRRYHAYQSETTGMQLSSNFTPIGVVHMVESGNPSIDDIEYTSTKNGEMPANSKVVVTGSAVTHSSPATLSLTAKAHDGSATYTDTDDLSCDVTSLPVDSDETYTCTFSGAGAQWFRSHSSTNDARFDFTAILTGGGVASPTTRSNELIDFYAPSPGMDQNAIVSKDGVKGKMTSTLATDPSLAIDDTAYVDLTWKPNSGTAVTRRVYAADDGSWSAKPPAGVSGSGTVSAVATDAVYGKSARQTANFQLTPVQSALPFTGAKPWWWLAAGLVLAALAAIALALGLSAVHSRQNRGRHAL